MTRLLAWIAVGGLVVGGSIGGWLWWRRRSQHGDATPSMPPPTRERADATRATSHDQPRSTPRDNHPRHTTLSRDELPPAVVADLDAHFSGGWPPDDATIDALEPGRVVAFVARSEPTDDFEHSRDELILASVIEVDESHVRARVRVGVEHADHHGNTAGHGLGPGTLVEIPRAHVMLAAIAQRDASLPAQGYGSEGPAGRTFIPTPAGIVLRVHPSTVYDLVLPYVDEGQVLAVDRPGVEIEQIGERGTLRQIKIRESSERGPFAITLSERDEAEVREVARWSFALAQ